MSPPSETPPPGTAEATITLEDPEAPRIYRALRPEAGPGAHLSLEGSTLRLHLEAPDIGELRAAVNTHLRLLQVALDAALVSAGKPLRAARARG